MIKACDTGKSLKEHVGSHLVDPSAYSPIRSSAAAAEFAGIKDLANCTPAQNQLSNLARNIWSSALTRSALSNWRSPALKQSSNAVSFHVQQLHCGGVKL